MESYSGGKKMKKRIAAHTLGCKTNQYDTQAMLEQFLVNDYEIVDFNDIADVYLINTCSVTAVADKKSRQFIRRARANHDAIIMVCGCMSQRDGEMLKELGADIVIGTSKRHLAYELVAKYRGEIVSTVEDVHHIDFEKLNVSSFDNTRALIKIQEGCNVYCTYCIIAGLRGNPRSRDLREIEDEAKKLAANGFKEAVLTGTNLALFGEDTGLTLKDAIDAVCKSDIRRIRLGSLDPGIFDEEFIKYLAGNQKICRHFHISLQSGSEEILKKMGRNYTAAHYKKEVDIIRKYMPKAAISTDVMVGFAGETKRLFLESLEFVRSIGFSKVHVFPYSIRPGTKAANFKEQLPNTIKQKRVALMQKAGNESRKKYLDSMIGQKAFVLLEKKGKDNEAFGYSDEYIRVKVNGGADKLGEIIEVTLDEKNIVVD